MRFCALVVLVSTLTLSAATPPEIAAGRVLIYRNGCGHCHPLGSSAGAPDLAGLHHRFSPSLLPGLIGSPRSLKSTSRMPHLFGSDPETAGEDLEALTHYLLSIPAKGPDSPTLPGDSTRGRKLYHEVGCAACHQPDAAEDLSDSVPIAMARHYKREHLVAYLLAPKSLLMPSLKLSPQEASDLAAWLQRDVVHEHEAPPTLSPSLIQKGRALFRSRRCISCHGAPEERPERTPPLIEINQWNDGCLSSRPRAEIPHFSFTSSQRKAITAAGTTRAQPGPEEIIAQTLTALRCYACHQRKGMGGPSHERRKYFQVTEQMAESYGDFGRISPKLDHLGRKLTHQWLRRILAEGHGEVRPYLATRMPHYRIPKADLEKLITAFEDADQRDPPIDIDVTGLPRHQRGHYGRDLIGSKGLNCITCHGLKGQRALGAPNIDLTHTVQRLRPTYFKELLLDPHSVQPGTLMPPLFLHRPKANQEVEQLWTYLKELDQRRLPDGLLRTGDFELKPALAGKPIVIRTFMQTVGTHAIAIGYPEGTHLAFDSRTSQWTLLWKGRFLDAMSTWDDRYATPAQPLSEDLYHFPQNQTKRHFRGFRLTKSGVPIFLYEENGVTVEDSVAPLPTGELRRTLKRGDTVTRQRVPLHNGKAFFRDEN
jgi:mono/diheme cytochrome c family protein